MDREAKVAAARRKLKQFKRKKEHKKTAKPKNAVTASPVFETDLDSLGEGSVQDIKKAEVIDERFQILNSADCGSTSESTALASGIIQASAKLKGLAAEAEMLIDDSSVQSSEEKFQIIGHPEVTEMDGKGEFPNGLEERNMELALNLSSVSQKNEELKQHCAQLSNEVLSLQTKLSETQHLHDEENSLQEQLQVQMQTISVLVSEKQGLQQELMVAQSSLNSSNMQQEKADDQMKSLRDEIMHLKRDLLSRSDALELAESNLCQVKSDNDSYTQELEQMKQTLEKEKLQSYELASKLQSKEAAYHELHISYTEACEKLQMADVLVKQLSVNSDLNAISQLQEENETMTSRFNDYQQAFQQLTAERENLNQQYSDAQKVWEEQLNALRERIHSLEVENRDILEDNSTLKSSLEEKSAQSTQQVELQKQETCDQKMNVETELEEVKKNYGLLHGEMLAQEKNNQQLAALIQEKESYIIELENELRQAKMTVEGHEQLMVEARNDKVTISRALVQNRQLKERLEEIQEGFIRMSNDKMDLASKLSSLEHINKELMSRLEETISRYNEAGNGIEQSENESEQSRQQPSDTQWTAGDTPEDRKMEETYAENGEDEDPYILNNFKRTEDVQSVSQLGQHQEEEVILSSPENLLNMENNDSVSEKDASEPFNAEKMLHEKFTILMGEKAELLNRLELLEHANTQLQNECDTIGEYIALYHNQRQVLRRRHREKDEYISSIVREREAMMGKIEQLQMLIVTVLRNRQNTEEELAFHTSDLLNSSLQDEQHARTRLYQGQPDLVPEAEIAIYNEEPRTKSPETLPGRSRKVTVHSESSNSDSDDVTTSQILTLLEEIQKPADTTALCRKMSMPSGFGMNYIGPYTAI